MSEDRNLKLCKKLLKLKTFSGSFKEKRLCKDILEYRDVINVIDSNFSIDLQLALELLDEQEKFVGIVFSQSSSEKISLWTILDNEEPFGDYYFQVRSIKVTDKEVYLKLKVVDEYNNHSSKNKSSLEDFDITKIDWQNISVTKISQDTANVIIAWILSLRLDWPSVKSAIQFVGFLVVFVFTELPNIVRFIGDFTIRVFREFNNFIHVCTPIFLSIINLIGKMYGGLLILISSFRKQPQQQRRVQYLHQIKN